MFVIHHWHTLPGLIFPLPPTPAGSERGGWIMQGEKFVFLNRHRLSHQGCRPRLYLGESISYSCTHIDSHFLLFYQLKKYTQMNSLQWLYFLHRLTPQPRPMGWGRVVRPTSSLLRRVLGGLWRCLMATRLSQRKARSQFALLRALDGYLMPTPSPASTYKCVLFHENETEICAVLRVSKVIPLL